MQPSKWEVWPWNWRKVRKAEISNADRDLFERYGEAVIVNILAGAGPKTDELVRAFLKDEDKIRARDWLTEYRDSQHRREQRLETIEIGVVVLITAEIVLSIIFGAIGIYEGLKQGNALDAMARSTADTAATMQTVRDELKSLAADQAKTREILQQQEADRAKKPRLVLYVGNTPIDKATVRLTSVAGNPQDTAPLDFLVTNLGDAPVSTFQLHVLAPAGAGLIIQDFAINPEFGPPLPRNAQRWTLQLPQLPVGQTKSIHAQVYVQKGHAAFKLAFTADAPELQGVILLGFLTVLPPKP